MPPSKRAVQRYFDGFSPRYDRGTPWRFSRPLLRWFRARLQESQLVLDAGCGTGIVTRVAAEAAAVAVGVDFSLGMLSIANRRGGRYVCADVEALPFRDWTFDAATCRQLLHYSGPEKTLKEICRVLKPGGQFLIEQSTSFGAVDLAWWKMVKRTTQPLRRTVFPPDALAAIVRDSGFVIEEIKIVVFHREQTIEDFFKESILDEPRLWDRWLRKLIANTSSGLTRLLGLSLDGNIIRYRQTWTLIRGTRP